MLDAPLTPMTSVRGSARQREAAAERFLDRGTVQHVAVRAASAGVHLQQRAVQREQATCSTL